MLAPAVAILSDRIPLSQRGTMSAFTGAGQIVGQSLGTIIGSAFLQNAQVGFIIGVVLWVLSGIITVFILPRELPSENTNTALDWKAVLAQFRPPTKNAGDFYLALIGRLLLIFGYQMIIAYQLYVCMKYVNLSTAEAGAVVSTMAIITMVISLVVSLGAGPISDKIGKRKAPIFAASALIAIGFAIPWLFPTTTSMYLMSGIAGLGYGIYMAVDQALNVDVLLNPDEAGKDLGILNLANTLGQIVAPLVTSAIVLISGNYFLTFPVSIAAVMLGAVVILFIKKAK